MQLPSAADMMTKRMPGASLLEGFFQSSGQVQEISREVAEIANEVRARVEPIELDLDDPEVRKALPSCCAAIGALSLAWWSQYRGKDAYRESTGTGEPETEPPIVARAINCG